MSKKLIYLTSFILTLSLAVSASAGLPVGWSSRDIGSPIASGSANYNDAERTWTVSGNGHDIWGSSDAFHFAYIPLSGDGMIVARVLDNGSGSDSWAKGGVMIRETLDANSKHAMMIITGGAGSGKAFQCRPSTGGYSLSSHEGTQVLPPAWVKLVREGNLFTGYYSVDGVDWQQPDGTGWDMAPNPIEINMTRDVYIGVCVTSVVVGEVRTYTFDNVSIELPKLALRPDPADGAVYKDTWVSLSWVPGAYAVSHDVYFGDNLDDVLAGAESVFQGNQTATWFSVGTPQSPYLVPGMTYYWRIDEVNDAHPESPWKGDVWSFTTALDIAVTDPNLLCWWTFDEIEGTTAVDYSGHNHYGTVNGASWVANGRVGGALDFGGDGDHVIDEDAENYLNGLDALTVCMWIKSDVTNTDKGFINCEQPDNGDNIITMRYDASGVTGGGTNLLKMAVVAPYDEQQLESSSNLQTTEWQHVCMTWSTEHQLKFYVNGVEDMPQANSGPRNVTTSGVTTLIIGKGAKDISGGWDGIIDDVRIYNIVLSDAEIYTLGAPSNASAPSPADGATDVTRTPTLRWTTGDRALQHDVYFGADKEAVRNANLRSPEYKDTRDLGSESYEPGKLEWNTTYYWRVDEYNIDATISKGKVWSFTVVAMVYPLAKALDTDLSFTTGGSEDWFGQTATSYYGRNAAQSGSISNSEDSWMQTTVSGTGTLKFYWKVSCEDNFDFLEFYIDGLLQDQISGSVDWQQKTYTMTTSGLHTLEWRYVKDDSSDSGRDCGWVDKVEWVTYVSEFDIYTDHIAPNIIESSWISNGILDFHSQENPASGDFCIHWTGVDHYNNISFRFSPVKDLSELVDQGCAIDFWARCSRPNARFHIGFVDTKKDERGDHPWQVRYSIDRNVAEWNGQWNHLQIPLNVFFENGSWDNDRYWEPVGDFDWTATEYFQIVAEDSDLVGIHFYFDDIRMVDPGPAGRP